MGSSPSKTLHTETLDAETNPPPSSPPPPPQKQAENASAASVPSLSETWSLPKTLNPETIDTESNPPPPSPPPPPQKQTAPSLSETLIPETLDAKTSPPPPSPPPPPPPPPPPQRQPENASADVDGVDNGGGDPLPIVIDESGEHGVEEEEEMECGFCIFMKGGGCKDDFTAWENCMDEAHKSGEDITEKCFEVTSLLKKCMEAHAEYYEPILRAEQTMAEAVEEASEAIEEASEAAKEASESVGEASEAVKEASEAVEEASEAVEDPKSGEAPVEATKLAGN